MVKAKKLEKTRLSAKLKAFLGPNSESQAAATSVNANNTNSATAGYTKIKKINEKTFNSSNGPAVHTKFSSKIAVDSTQQAHTLPKMTSTADSKAEVTPKFKRPKDTPKLNSKVTSNDREKSTKSEKGQCQLIGNGKKNKKKKPKSTVTEKPKVQQNHTNRDEGKRKLEHSKPGDENHTKRMKKDRNGFIETNIDSDVEIAKPKKLKKKTEKIDECKRSASKDNDVGPSVKVFSVDESQLNGESDRSDSETDSYIDKFFQDDNNEFDENRVYSVDEIEMKNRNFLGKASGDRAQSDDTSSEDSYDSNSDDNNSSSSTSNNFNVASNNLEKYSGRHVDDGYDDETDDMYYTDGSSSSDISLGSVLDSDDLDDTYECEEESEESSNGHEMHSSYDEDEDASEDDSELDDDDDYDHSDYSNSDNECSSHDTYDEFLNSRHYDSSNDDQDYNNSRYDDVHIAQGTAISYKIADKRIKIFENDTESRIIEVPKTDSEDEKCVNLIPIDASRAKLLKMERRKRMANQAKLDEKKREDEMARLAHEKAVSDYYNMDNIVPLNRSTVDRKRMFKNSVSMIKCPKNFEHVTLDWMEVDDIETQTHAELGNYPAYPESKAKRVIAIQSETNSSKRLKKSKTKANDVEIEQNHIDVQTHEVPIDEDKTKTDDGKASAAPSKRTKPSQVQIKPKESQFFNSINSRHVLLLLRNALHFHGSLHVKLIAGKAVAFGYELQHNKTITLHSPRGHGFISLIPIADPQPSLHALDNLTADFYLQDIEYLKTHMNCGSDAIVLLEREQSNKGVNMIDRYMRETMFPNINAFNNDSPFYSSEFVLHCKFLTTPDNGLMHNAQWSTIKIQHSTKLMAIGGKGVGKSTFMRYLINSNIGKFPKFLYIDLDIGQPELFVPQTLSATVVSEPILGPGYLQNIKPLKAVLFGDINILPNPIKYLRCVLEMFTFCSSQSELATIPWVINTMGYSRGFGNELIACILKIFQPSDVVQIQSGINADNFVQIMTADTVNAFKFNVFEREMSDIGSSCQHKMHTFDAMRGKSNRKQLDMTAKDLRYTMILAKLGNCLKYNTDWITSVKPFEASLNHLEVLITSGDEIKPSDHLDLLDGSLVYLCGRQQQQTTDIIDCFGIGIVRSIDAPTGKLYLVSTIPLSEMQHVNVLAIGAIPLPSAVFLNQHVQVRGTIPYVYNSDNFIGSKQVALHIFRPESKSNNKPIQLMDA